MQNCRTLHAGLAAATLLVTAAVSAEDNGVRKAPRGPADKEGDGPWPEVEGEEERPADAQAAPAATAADSAGKRRRLPSHQSAQRPRTRAAGPGPALRRLDAGRACAHRLPR